MATTITALGDVLLVSGLVDKRQPMFIQHTKRSRRSAATLDVGLPFGIGRCHVRAGLCSDEVLQFRRDLHFPRTTLLHAGIAKARPLRACMTLTACVKATSLT